MQPNLFTDPPPVPYQPGSRTSQMGAADAAPRFVGHAKRILRLLYQRRERPIERRGASQAEMSALLQISRQSVTNPVKRLEEAEYIRKAPEIPDRLNAETGSKCGVYIITEKGVEAWHEVSTASR